MKGYKYPHKAVSTRNGESKMTHKLVALFTEDEARGILQRAASEDRSAGNLMHFVMREYIAGRLHQ